MKTIIAGSRSALFYHVEQAISRCPWSPRISEVVSGGAVGADRAGEWYALGYDIDNAVRYPLKIMEADWGTYGRTAGVLRNQAMADYADALIAVWDGKSPGTRNMIYEARKRGLRVFVWDYRQRVELDGRNRPVFKPVGS